MPSTGGGGTCMAWLRVKRRSPQVCALNMGTVFVCMWLQQPGMRGGLCLDCCVLLPMYLLTFKVPGLLSNIACMACDWQLHTPQL